jgi:hypothetical protein
MGTKNKRNITIKEVKEKFDVLQLSIIMKFNTEKYIQILNME